MKKYKALIFDLDGTAVVLNQYAKPTQKVVDAVREAEKHVLVSVATGRPIGTARWLTQPLGIKEPSIITAGTQIIDPISEKILWEVTMPKETVQSVLDVASHFPYKTFVGSQFENFPASPRKELQKEAVVYIVEVLNEDVKNVLDALEKVPDILIHKAVGYNPNQTDIHITNIHASKKHAIEELIKMLHVQKEDIIGVGDGWNDLALFESVGLKVAMGNAVEKLKEKADYIAPSVEDDGLAEVIQKFILNDLL